MVTLQQLREFFGQDHFAVVQGIEIEEAGGGTATCSVVLQPRHMNALGTVQGGLIFTLADFTFAAAVNSEVVGGGTVTLNSTIHYLRAAKGKRLIGKAAPVNRGNTVSVYEVHVTDDVGTPVAYASFTGFTSRAAKK